MKKQLFLLLSTVGFIAGSSIVATHYVDDLKSNLQDVKTKAASDLSELHKTISSATTTTLSKIKDDVEAAVKAVADEHSKVTTAIFNTLEQKVKTAQSALDTASKTLTTDLEKKVIKDLKDKLDKAEDNLKSLKDKLQTK